MKLQQKPLEAIKSGLKIIESRLFDEKRQLIHLGDEIIFKSSVDATDSATVKVIGLLRYSTFSLLFSDFQPAAFGGVSKKVLEEQIYTYYSKEDENKFGVLGIRIQLAG